MDTKLISKYSRKDQNHEDNLQLKSDILDFLSGKIERVITKEYISLGMAGYYRRVALKFLEDLGKIRGIDVRQKGKRVIVERC